MTKRPHGQSSACQPVYAGVDVAKDWLDIYLHPLKEARRFTNDKAGIDDLGNWLQSLDIALLACEATGRLEHRLVRVLSARGLTVRVVNPSQISAFRTCCGKLAKTDNLDAQLIALFAATIPVMERAVPDEAQQILKDYAMRRRQVVQMLTAERNRLKRAEDTIAADSIRRMIRILEKERAGVEQAMLAHVDSHEVFRVRMEILISIPGIGQTSALTLISEMPELGSLTDKQAGALAGLAPMDRESGRSRKTASVRGGRKCVRAALYMAAMSAKKHNPVIKTFYDRLVTENKRPKMVALTASMRKLLLIANQLLAEGRPWKEQMKA